MSFDDLSAASTYDARERNMCPFGMYDSVWLVTVGTTRPIHFVVLIASIDIYIATKYIWYGGPRDAEEGVRW